ncbi:MAG: hypothetical protein A2808_03440 [Candidatus Moranbacteria bacterium RIFCSPHIGHO2_01_FULL_55_24]|nr:MAG: hypothetical protein A2808_03440 [Candidatus Moranbacteria bacterium RIFCSPHIGHO2_01_FULL_55_24]
MKILLINKYHYLKGGAERAYFDMARLLEEAGHEVAFFSMEHPENQPTPWSRFFVSRAEYRDDSLPFFRKAALAGKLIYNFEAKRKLRALLAEFRPDIAHAHNIYHQISPSIFSVLEAEGIPVVMTLHDYKIVSPNYNLFSKGRIWEHTSGLRCIADACVHDSRLRSTLCALEKWLHALLGSYRQIDLFLSPSRFLRDKCFALGFSGKIEYLPNPLLSPAPVMAPVSRHPDQFLFFGRLSQEKGVGMLLEAFTLLGPEKRLVIVGDGPERQRLEHLSQEKGLADRVQFTGALYGSELEAKKAESQAVILPSLWYENLPYVLTESLQSGCLVIASESGGMAERIRHGENGFLFEMGDTRGLADIIRDLGSHDLEAIREKARESVADLEPGDFMRKLLAFYAAAIKN